MKYFSFGRESSDPEKKPLLTVIRTRIKTAGNEGSKSSDEILEKDKSWTNLTDSGDDWKTPQHVAALAATLGVLISGSTVGWSSPVMFKIRNENSTDYDFDISPSQSDWISSVLALGSAFISLPIGLIMDRIGRKTTMLLLTIPLTLGWLLITFGTSVGMLIAGRFICGAGGGAFYVTAPAYVSEIAQDSNRGNLGSYFQLMLNIGALFSFIVGSYTSVFILNIMCTAIPIIFGIILFNMPESPNFLVVKSRSDEAKESLTWLRSRSHNVDKELNKLKFKAEKAKIDRGSYIPAFTKKSDINACLICLFLVFFHQLCGIIAVIFNASQIFYDAGTSISTEMATVIIGVLQVCVSVVSSLVMDKVGRRILLLISSLSMSICSTVLGAYFFLLQTYGYETVEDITWLPLLSLSVFVSVFTIGLGPIPWIMIGDLCRIEIKAFVGSTAGTLNWLLAFTVTCSFHPLNEAIGAGQVYWIFAIFTFVGFIFIFLVVPETKGKNIDEIQVLLGDEAEETSQENK